jgi:peptidyl-prolyl cis-trans isomerase C
MKTALRAFAAFAVSVALWGQAAPKTAAAKPKTVAPKPAASKKAAAPPAAPAKVAPVDPNDPVVITVGSQKISRSQFEVMYRALPDQVRARYNTTETKKQLAEQLAELIALAEEARRRKIDQEAKVSGQIRVQTDQILASALMQQFANTGVIDEIALRDYFDKNKAQYQQVVARHVLIRFQGSPVPLREGQKELSEADAMAKAEQIRQQLGGGADFAEVARKESDDVGSAQAGGSLGAFGRGQMVKPFEDAAFSLPMNEISQPVKSQFGYHLIQVQEQKNQKFEDVRSLVEQRLKSERPRQMAEEIKKRAGITIDASQIR